MKDIDNYVHGYMSIYIIYIYILMIYNIYIYIYYIYIYIYTYNEIRITMEQIQSFLTMHFPLRSNSLAFPYNI